tara:strand:+ start:7775 stop:8305 length:531 start_codon:yes stop_codon:yes gene_type:complete
MKLSNFQKWAVLILTIILGIYLHFSGILKALIELTGNFGIIGVLISGIFFGYAFTAAPATASLISYTNYFNPIIISFIGATGTMIGDLLIFNIFKKGLPKEVDTIIKSTKLDRLKKSKFKWLLVGIAGFIIASPLPDEIGVSLLGINKWDTVRFMLLTFSLNFIGILVITSIAWFI